MESLSVDHEVLSNDFFNINTPTEDPILNEVLETMPAKDTAPGITHLFLDLLGRQFPINTTDYVLKLRRASDYALHLSVHVNRLNLAVTEITGKSPTDHIADRIVQEATALLRNKDWGINEIAYCLGFEYASYFNNFFKRKTGFTPLSMRK